MATSLRYPNSINSGGDTMEAYIKFSIFERTTRLQSFPKVNIFLFMPERVYNPSTVGWESEKLGVVIGQIEKQIRSGQTPNVDTIMAGVTTAASIGASKIFDTAASKAQQAMGTPFDWRSGLSSATGMITNPYVTMIFKGVDLRTFEFEFKLYPHSKQEATDIENIIKAFRMASLPPGSGDTMSGPWLGYPDEFDIEYVFEGKTNPHLNRFKRSVLVGINTDYTASGMWSMTRDGFPTETSLSLRFQELSIVLRDDVDMGGY